MRCRRRHAATWVGITSVRVARCHSGSQLTLPALFPHRRRRRKLDADGHLKIIEPRLGDVGHPSTGEMFAPNYIENKLKSLPAISRRGMTASPPARDPRRGLHQHRSDGRWHRRPSGATWLNLASNRSGLRRRGLDPNRLGDCGEKVNAELATEGELSHCRSSGSVLHKSLTRTTTS